ncbi:MAG: antibiotic biosynthesis monooxygenase [Verrucomicrobiales bacterium]|nr:antibiotic biosynthesis monooxygenase [Verrucomicrobiales bacterium]
MHAIVVTLEANPGKTEALLAALEANAIGSRQEAGCHKWEYSQHVDHPNQFAIYELYDDLAAIKAHKSSEHFLAWVKCIQTGELIANKQAGIYQVI